MSQTLAVPRQQIEEVGGIMIPVAKTVFDKPRGIARIVNGKASLVVRTSIGLRWGEETKEWKKVFEKEPELAVRSFKPLQEGTYNDLVEYLAQQHCKGAADIEQWVSLNPNDPIPRMEFFIPDLDSWRRRPINYIDTGTAWVGFQTRQEARRA